MDSNKSENVVWQHTGISRKNREKLLKQKGCLIWFTGLSGAGKSTIAEALNISLYEKGYLTTLLDGDNLRHGLNSDLGFTKEHRIENIRRVKEVAKLFVEAGIITLSTFISPFQLDRKGIREKMGEDFIEVFVDCELEVCESRDPKGLYKRAREGSIKDFTGIDSEYERPENPEIVLYSHKESIEECRDKILSYLQEKNLIKNKNSWGG